MMDVKTLGVPRLDDYLGLWAMEQQAFYALRDLVMHTNLAEHVAAHREQENPKRVVSIEVNAEGVAVLNLAGFMTKTGSSFSELQDGTVGLRREIRAAVSRSDVKAIMLRVDSPGGSTKGVDDLAQEVARASSIKPVTAYIEDLGASAAYFVASQATRVVANQGAVVGAIGTYGVIYDFSKMFESEGIKTFVVRAGAMKGAGSVGAEISESQLVDFQREVNEVNEPFVSAVSSARGLVGDRLEAVTDGRVHVGLHAMEMGLVDAIETFDEAMTELVSRANNQGGRAMLPPAKRANMAAAPPRSQREEITTMSTKQTPPATVETSQAAATAVAPPSGMEALVPATLAELKAKFPQSDPAFREKCLEGNFCMASATDAWIEELNSTIAKKDADLEQAKAQAKKPGNQPVVSGTAAASATEGDPIAAWDNAVATKVKAGMSKATAIRKCVHEDPDGHQAYIAAYNTQRRTA